MPLRQPRKQDITGTPPLDTPVILGLETSCDETAAAVSWGHYVILSSVISSQIPLHQPYGGVVPELASRNHLTMLRPMLEDALAQAGYELDGVDAFAATLGPGLAGCLLTGATLARALAWSTGKPFLGVNHLEAHLLSPFEGRPQGIQPCVALVVSGGHTLLVEIDEFGSYTLLGRTRDDAAGEAFDKCAKMLGLPYPGGPQVDRLAREENADPQRFDFPRAMLSSGDLNFSFSGLKTSVRTAIETLRKENTQLTETLRRDLCASFQEAIVDVLCAKLIQACHDRGHSLAAVSGGVSLNSRLRARLRQEARDAGIQLLLASPKLCTDNAAMICYAAAHAFHAGQFTDLNQDINPNMPFITQPSH